MSKQNQNKEIEDISEKLSKLRNDLDIITKSMEKRLVEHPEGRQFLDKFMKEDEKLRLIGSLPFVLLDKKYFPANEELIKFAKELNIDIKFGHKRSRNEILGTIIAKVSEKNPKEISRLTMALNKMIGKRQTGEIKNFFTEWDKIIRET